MRRALSIVAALLAVYIVAYLVDVRAGSAITIERIPGGIVFTDLGYAEKTVLRATDPPWPRIDDYRVGGELARRLFAPLLAVDKQLRPGKWTCTFEEDLNEATEP